MEQAKGATPAVSAEALKAAKAIAQMRHPPLSVDLVVAAAKMIDELVAQEVQAALGHVEYLHMMESDDKADKAVEARVARIVGRLTAKREWDSTLATNGEEKGEHFVSVAIRRQAVQVWDSAIAIAREEGEG